MLQNDKWKWKMKRSGIRGMEAWGQITVSSRGLGLTLLRSWHLYSFERVGELSMKVSVERGVQAAGAASAKALRQMFVWYVQKNCQEAYVAGAE